MKHRQSLFLALAATAGVFGASSFSPAQAAAIRYNLNNLNVATGGNVTGYFTFDINGTVGVNQYSDTSITVAGTSLSTFDQVYTAGNIDQTSSGAGFLTLSNSGKSLNLLFSPSILNSTPAQSVSIFGPASSVTSSIPSASSNLLAGGTAVAVPFETDVLPVLASTLVFAGALWWKRKQAEKKVATFLSSNVNANPEVSNVL